MEYKCNKHFSVPSASASTHYHLSFPKHSRESPASCFHLFRGCCLLLAFCWCAWKRKEGKKRKKKEGNPFVGQDMHLLYYSYSSWDSGSDNLSLWCFQEKGRGLSCTLVVIVGDGFPGFPSHVLFWESLAFCPSPPPLWTKCTLIPKKQIANVSSTFVPYAISGLGFSIAVRTGRSTWVLALFSCS